MIPSHIADKMQIHFEIEILAPPARVWAKLASQTGMHEWFSKRLAFEPRLGGKFRMEVRDPDDGEFVFFGEVIKVEPERELAFTWTEHEKDMQPWPVSTLVTFRLAPTARGTLVSLTHSGFEALEAALAKREYEGHIVGWERSAVLHDLKSAVESDR